MKMETNKKQSAQNTYTTLKEWSEDEGYLTALAKMEKMQKNYIRARMRRIDDDIEPLDWDELGI